MVVAARQRESMRLPTSAVRIEGVAGHIVDVLRRGPAKYRVVKVLQFPGGDWFIRDKLLGVIVKAPASTLVEVFGGSGVVSEHAPRDRFKKIVYNDKDDLLTNFYRVLRDRPEELARKIALLPVSRSLREIIKKEITRKDLDPVSKAAYLYYLTRTGFFGNIDSSYGIERTKSKNSIFKATITGLPEVARRWRDVEIENRDWRDIIRLYDSPQTVFYLDPPYVSSSEVKGRENFYRLSFTPKDLRALAEALSRIKGYYVLKLSKDNYGYVKRHLGKHYVYPLVIKKSMAKVIGGKRPTTTLLIITNFPVKGSSHK